MLHATCTYLRLHRSKVRIRSTPPESALFDVTLGASSWARTGFTTGPSGEDNMLLGVGLLKKVGGSWDLLKQR